MTTGYQSSIRPLDTILVPNASLACAVGGALTADVEDAGEREYEDAEDHQPPEKAIGHATSLRFRRRISRGLATIHPSMTLAIAAFATSTARG